MKYKALTDCPNCGCRKVQTKYDGARNTMVRKCERCFYTFYQEPLDSNKSDTEILE